MTAPQWSVVAPAAVSICSFVVSESAKKFLDTKSTALVRV
jgi:hypothetical protein